MMPRIISQAATQAKEKHEHGSAACVSFAYAYRLSRYRVNFSTTWCGSCKLLVFMKIGTFALPFFCLRR